jgi:hypothetical protein
MADGWWPGGAGFTNLDSWLGPGLGCGLVPVGLVCVFVAWSGRWPPVQMGHGSEKEMVVNGKGKERGRGH